MSGVRIPISHDDCPAPGKSNLRRRLSMNMLYDVSGNHNNGRYKYGVFSEDTIPHVIYNKHERAFYILCPSGLSIRTTPLGLFQLRLMVMRLTRNRGYCHPLNFPDGSFMRVSPVMNTATISMPGWDKELLLSRADADFLFFELDTHVLAYRIRKDTRDLVARCCSELRVAMHSDTFLVHPMHNDQVLLIVPDYDIMMVDKVSLFRLYNALDDLDLTLMDIQCSEHGSWICNYNPRVNPNVVHVNVLIGSTTRHFVLAHDSMMLFKKVVERCLFV